MILLVKKSRRCWSLEREEEDEGIVSEDFQLVSTKLGKEGSVSHICSNLKGFCDLHSSESVFSKMG